MTGFIDSLINRQEKLQSDRYNYEDTWQLLADYILPNRGNFTTTNSPGTRNKTRVFDTTAGTANKLLAATLHVGLTNAATRWLELNTQNASLLPASLNKSLEKAADAVLDVFNSTESNFQSQVHEFYLSLTSLGTAAMFVTDDDKGRIHFGTIHISEIFVEENNFGMVDTVFRKFCYSPRQAVQMWGEDKVHPSLLKMLVDTPDEKLDFIHAVMPREDAERKDKVGNISLPIASYYIDIKHKHLIDEKGFHEMPYIISRFEKLSGEVYGRSSGWDALPSILMINKMQQTIIRAGQLAAAPPLLVSDDGVMMPLQVKPNGIITGGISLDGAERIKPLQLGNNIPINLEMIKQTEKAIRDAFFVDQLIFRDEGTPVTATEIVQRQQEKLRLLNPHLGRLTGEFLNPCVERVYGLLSRSGKIPKELRALDIDISYHSPLLKLQKGADIEAFQRFIASIEPLAQLDPSVLDAIDPEATTRNLAEAAGMRLENLRTPEEVEQVRQSRAQQQQLENELQTAETLSKVQPPQQ